MKITCACCRYFSPKSAGHQRDECRRHTPTPRLTSNGRHDEFGVSVWPAVSSDGWCGEFKPAIDASSVDWHRNPCKDSTMNNTLNIAHVVQRLRTLRWTRLSQLVMRRRKQRNTWPHGCARQERDYAQRTGPPGNPPPLHGHREQGPVSAQFVSCDCRNSTTIR